MRVIADACTHHTRPTHKMNIHTWLACISRLHASPSNATLKLLKLWLRGPQTTPQVADITKTLVTVIGFETHGNQNLTQTQVSSESEELRAMLTCAVSRDFIQALSLSTQCVNYTLCVPPSHPGPMKTACNYSTQVPDERVSGTAAFLMCTLHLQKHNCLIMENEDNCFLLSR